MAHIPDGVLSAPVLAGGALMSAALVGVALRRLDYERIPQAAVLAAAFFVCSLVAVPIGAGSVHLLLNGLMGLVLGWAAVPAVLVALILQALFFGYGGVVVLGVNAFNIALPAVACAYALRPLLSRSGPRGAFWLGAAAGLLGALGTGTLVAGSLAASGESLLPAARVIVATYLPLAAAEAAIGGVAVSFLLRVAPDLLRPGSSAYA